MTDPVRPAPRPKKTEMIEVRVAYEVKRDFLAACQRAERTASDVIREAVDDFIAGRTKAPAPKKMNVLALIPKPLRKKSYLAAGAAMAGLTAFAVLPSAAAPGIEASFKAMDANGDGVISHDEFLKQGAGTKRLELKPVGKPAATSGADGGAIYFLPGDGGKADAGLRDVTINHLSPPSTPNPEEARSTRFALFDVNNDGKLDRAEYSARETALATNGFHKLDTNGDGELDQAEYNKLGDNVIVYPAEAAGFFSTDAKFGPVVSPDALKTEFDRLDADKNGKLSLAEYLPAR